MSNTTTERKAFFKKFRGTETPEAEMSFLDHLEVLRWHIVRSAIVLVLVAVVIFIKIDWVFDHIIYAPAGKNFITYSATLQSRTQSQLRRRTLYAAC